MKTENELRAIKNPKIEPIKRQKINMGIKDNRIVIYRNIGFLTDRIIDAIDQQNQQVLFNYLKYEGSTIALNNREMKNFLKERITPQSYHTLYDQVEQYNCGIQTPQIRINMARDIAILLLGDGR